MRQSIHFILFFFMIFVFISGCSKGKEAPESTGQMSSAPQRPNAEKKVLDDVDNKSNLQRRKKLKKMASNTKLTSILLDQLKKIDGRFLEYRVHLKFKTDDLLQSRNALLILADKYGFVKKTNSYWQTTEPYIYSELHVSQNKLYQALLDIEKIGELISEKIKVVDHTGEMTWAKMKIDREKARQNRKIRLSQRVDRKSLTQVERLLERNEDNEDRAKFKKWQIKDKVQWAKIFVRLEGPANPVQWDMPDFRNAFIHALQFFLSVIYGLIVILPVLIVVILLWWQRKRIRSIFSRKEEKDKKDKENKK